MSGLIGGLFGGGANSWFQPHPTEAILHNAARVHYNQEDPVVYHPVPDQKSVAKEPQTSTPLTSKVVAGTTVGLGILTTADKLYDSKVVNKITQTVTQIPEAVKTTASATAETVKETASSLFDSLGWSTVGLGFMSYLPYSVQYLVAGAGVVAVGFGISGAIGLYRSCRHPNGYGAGATNTVNVHLNLPGMPSNCKPVVNTHSRPDGSKDVHVGMECKAPEVPSVIKENVATVYARKAPLRAANKLTLAKQYHEELRELSEEAKNPKSSLSDALKVSIKQLVEQYDELEKQEYVVPSLTGHLARAGDVIMKAHNEKRARDYHKRLKVIFDNSLTLLSNYGDHHLKDDVVRLKNVFDGFEKKHFDVRNLSRHLDAAALTIADADKEITEYTRGVALRMRAKRKFRE